MTQSAWEIKNKFIYTLHRFPEAIVKREWKEWIQSHPHDEYAFVNYLLKNEVAILGVRK